MAMNLNPSTRVGYRSIIAQCLPKIPRQRRCHKPSIKVSASYNNEYKDLSLAINEIKSLTNPTVKHCVKLRTQRSYRNEHQTTILAGADLVSELARDIDLLTLFFLIDTEPHPSASATAHKLTAVTEGAMAKICGLESVASTMLAAEVALPRDASFATWEQGRLTRLLVLDRCQDPGNLGTLLRTAIALGWDGVFLLPGCADPFNEKSIRASRGACFKIPIGYGTFEDWKEVTERHNLVCLAADLERQAAAERLDFWDGKKKEEISPSEVMMENWKVSLILGSEGQGVSPEMLEECTSVSIPMVGDMESLNVGAAGAILMWALSSVASKLDTILVSALNNSSSTSGSGNRASLNSSR